MYQFHTLPRAMKLNKNCVRGKKLWRLRESVFMIIFALKGESIKALQVINLLRKDCLKISTTDF